MLAEGFEKIGFKLSSEEANDRMYKKWLAVPLLVSLLVVFAFIAGCPAPADDAVDVPDKLVFGGVRSQSGYLAIFDQIVFGPVYRMWAEEVNARGGIYVKEFDKRIPVELLIYDDTSDLGTMIRLLEKLMVEDQVHFLLPPVSTAFLYAAAPIVNEHGYLLLGAEGGAKQLEPLMAELPYFFSTLNHSVHQVPVLVDILAEAGVKSAAIIFVADLHGIEYSGTAIPLLEMNGIDVVFSKSVPPGIEDLTGIIADAQAADVDAFLAFVYPTEGFLAVRTAIEKGFNPDVFLIGPGGNFEFFKDIFGPAAEGVMAWGAWNEQSSPEAADFAKRLIEFTGERKNVDWWGQLVYYSALQVLEQAIEKAGTIDHSVLKNVIATEEFTTAMGVVRFERGGIPADLYPGHVGQWQNGIFEVIGPPDRATANPIIPKPRWPAP